MEVSMKRKKKPADFQTLEWYGYKESICTQRGNPRESRGQPIIPARSQRAPCHLAMWALVSATLGSNSDHCPSLWSRRFRDVVCSGNLQSMALLKFLFRRSQLTFVTPIASFWAEAWRQRSPPPHLWAPSRAVRPSTCILRGHSAELLRNTQCSDIFKVSLTKPKQSAPLLFHDSFKLMSQRSF